MARNPKNVAAAPREETKMVVESDAVAGRKNDRVNEKEWIDSDGNVTNDESVASGFRLRLRTTGETIEHQFGEPGTPRTMYAIFGALTKLGNEVTTLKAKGEPLSLETARAFHDHLIQTNEWGVPSQGGGARINIERLKTALTNYAAQSGAGVSKAMARLESGDIDYAKTLMNNPGVKAEYARLTVGGNAVADEELFD